MAQEGKTVSAFDPFKTFLIGQQGGETIYSALSSAEESPVEVITRFQRVNRMKDAFGVQALVDEANQGAPPGADAPSETDFEAILELIDLHGLRRSTISRKILENLVERMIERSSSLPTSRLDELLKETFPYIDLEEMRPLAFSVMSRIDNIPHSYLRQLTSQQRYEGCPLKVKRQIWLMDETILRREFSQILPLYEAELYNSGSSSRLVSDIALDTHKRREKNPYLQTMVQWVLSSVKLYSILLQYCRTLFVSTRKTCYCTLRTDLLLSLKDADATDIIEKDPCYKFAWCIDNCINSNRVDANKIKDMKTLIKSHSENDPMLGDLAMILADEYATHMMIKAINKNLQETTAQFGLPRKNKHLAYLMRLLSYGLNAHHIISTRSFKHPPEKKEAVREFAPLLMSRFVDHQINLTNRKLKHIQTIDQGQALEPELFDYLLKHTLERQILLFHILQTIKEEDSASSEKLLEQVEVLPDDILQQEISFISSLSFLAASIKDMYLRSLLKRFLFGRKSISTPQFQIEKVRFLLLNCIHMSRNDLLLHLEDTAHKLEGTTPAEAISLLSFYEKLLDRTMLRSELPHILPLTQHMEFLQSIKDHPHNIEDLVYRDNKQHVITKISASSSSAQEEDVQIT